MNEKKKLEINLRTGDCLKVLKETPDEFYDAAITDPPYGLGKEPDPVELLRGWIHTGHYDPGGGGFMSSNWDSIYPGPGTLSEIRRVVKKGARCGFFAGTRTLDIAMSSLRFAGFEIENVYSWVYGSGFPKSHNIYKALHKKLKKDGRYGAEGDLRCSCVDEDYVYSDELFEADAKPDPDQENDRCLILDDYGDNDLTCRVCSWCLLPDQQFIDSTEGLGTALKPAWEPIIIVRKPETPIELDYRELLEKYGCSEEQIEYIMTKPE